MATCYRLPPRSAASPQPPRDCTDHGVDIEELAIEFARQDAALAESLIETLVTQAVRQWRLDDATFWQRVKFHARLIRATSERLADGPH